MIDTNSSSDNVHDALTKLREQGDAWNKFEPLHEFELPPLFHWHHVNRNILAKIQDKRIVFRQLSAEPQWGFPVQWEVEIDFECHELSVYPEEDLIVAAEAGCVVSLRNDLHS